QARSATRMPRPRRWWSCERSDSALEARLATGRENLDLGDKHGPRRNHARHALIGICQMRRDFQSARAPDTHPLDAVEQAVDERLPVDAHVGDQGVTVVLDSGGVMGA